MLSIEAEGKHVYGKDTRRKKFPAKVWIFNSYLKVVLFGLLRPFNVSGHLFSFIYRRLWRVFSCHCDLKSIRNKNNNGFEIFKVIKAIKR
jgi:hypothetical protein